MLNSKHVGTERRKTPQRSGPRRKRLIVREQASFPLVFRVAGPLSARKEFGEAQHEAIADNLSESGLRIFAHSDLPDGVVLDLKFALMRSVGSPPEVRSRKMELQAEVRHSSPGLIRGSYVLGVNFIRPSIADRAFITGERSSV